MITIEEIKAFFEKPYMGDTPPFEPLVEHLPTICKMLLDMHAENERLKADSKPPQNGARVRYEGDEYTVDSTDKHYAVLIHDTYNKPIFAFWRDCEVIVT